MQGPLKFTSQYISKEKKIEKTLRFLQAKGKAKRREEEEEKRNKLLEQVGLNVHTFRMLIAGFNAP